jgi:hypothetical protein
VLAEVVRAHQAERVNRHLNPTDRPLSQVA